MNGHGKDDGGSMRAWLEGLAAGLDKVVSRRQNQYTCPMAMATASMFRDFQSHQ
jgi:hypothetical protein